MKLTKEIIESRLVEKTETFEATFEMSKIENLDDVIAEIEKDRDWGYWFEDGEITFILRDVLSLQNLAENVVYVLKAVIERDGFICDSDGTDRIIDKLCKQAIERNYEENLDKLMQMVRDMLVVHG